MSEPVDQPAGRFATVAQPAGRFATVDQPAGRFATVDQPAGRLATVDCGSFFFDLPDGWATNDDDEATYSDPDQQPPITVASPRGVLQVVAIAYDEDQLPGADPREVEGLAADWGARRGAPKPLSTTSGLGAGGAWAAAAYRLRDDFVEVWFLADGSGVLQASYVCPFAARDEEAAARGAVFASLRFGS